MTGNAGSTGRVIIIGGSMGGLFAGLQFLKIGWDVQIYERVTENLNARGAGIATHAELFAAMEAVGVDPGDDIGTTSNERAVYGQDGSLICTEQYDQILTLWGRLYDLMLRALPAHCYHRGRAFVRCSKAGNTVKAHFEDGDTVEGDLLIAADGIRSTAREQFEPDCQPQYCGYSGWRGLVPEADLPASFQKEIFPQMAFCLPQEQQFISYPVAGHNNDLRRGKRNCNILWYRPADAETKLPWMLTDIDGKNNGSSIVPNRIRPEVIAEMRNDALRELSPAFAEVMRMIEAPFLQPIYDLTVSRMAYDGVAIIGDAAFVARPHVALGVTKAAQDALVLADCCEGARDLDSALAAFEAKRLPAGRFIVQHARNMGSYLGNQGGKTDEQRQLAAHYNDPVAVMTETAKSDFLKALDG